MRKTTRMLRSMIVLLWLAGLLLPTGSQAQRPSDQIHLRRVDSRSVSVPVTSTDDAPRSWLFGTDSGADDGSSTLLRIDRVSANSYVMGETRFVDVTDVVFLSDGRLFGVTFTDLLSINPQTGVAVSIGSGIDFSAVNALDADSDGVLYAATLLGEFIRVDPVSGRGTLIGTYGMNLTSSGDIAFAPDGTLFGTATDGGPSDFLIRIDVAMI